MKNPSISKPVRERIIPNGEETSILQINTIFYPLCYPTQYITMVHDQSELQQASLAFITLPIFTMKKRKWFNPNTTLHNTKSSEKMPRAVGFFLVIRKQSWHLTNAYDHNRIYLKCGTSKWLRKSKGHS